MNENVDPLINLIERLADPNDPIRGELEDETKRQEHLAGLVPEDQIDYVVDNLRDASVYAELAAAFDSIRKLPAAWDDPAAPVHWLKLGAVPDPPPDPPHPPRR